MSQPRGTRARATKQAAAIVEVLGRMPGFSGARGIYDALREAGEQVGIATVYRHLRVLAEHGDVDMIPADRGETRYRLRADGTTCYLSCRACGESVPVDASEVRAWAEGLAAETGFTLTGYTAHLTGLCRTSCETGRAAAAAAAAAGPGPGDAGRGPVPPGPVPPGPVPPGPVPPGPVPPGPVPPGPVPPGPVPPEPVPPEPVPPEPGPERFDTV